VGTSKGTGVEVGATVIVGIAVGEVVGVVTGACVGEVDGVGVGEGLTVKVPKATLPYVSWDKHEVDEQLSENIEAF